MVLCNGKEKKLDVLVDTDAEANLIRQGLVEEHLTYPAKEALKFETANGQVLSGGDRCVTVSMQLQTEGSEVACVEYEVEFYDMHQS